MNFKNIDVKEAGSRRPHIRTSFIHNVPERKTQRRSEDWGLPGAGGQRRNGEGQWGQEVFFLSLFKKQAEGVAAPPCECLNCH